jgi:hypothetical protein
MSAAACARRSCSRAPSVRDREIHRLVKVSCRRQCEVAKEFHVCAQARNGELPEEGAEAAGGSGDATAGEEATYGDAAAVSESVYPDTSARENPEILRAQAGSACRAEPAAGPLDGVAGGERSSTPAAGARFARPQPPSHHSPPRPPAASKSSAVPSGRPLAKSGWPSATRASAPSASGGCATRPSGSVSCMPFATPPPSAAPGSTRGGSCGELCPASTGLLLRKNPATPHLRVQSTPDNNFSD